MVQATIRLVAAPGVLSIMGLPDRLRRSCSVRSSRQTAGRSLPDGRTLSTTHNLTFAGRLPFRVLLPPWPCLGNRSARPCCAVVCYPGTKWTGPRGNRGAPLLSRGTARWQAHPVVRPAFAPSCPGRFRWLASPSCWPVLIPIHSLARFTTHRWAARSARPCGSLEVPMRTSCFLVAGVVLALAMLLTPRLPQGGGPRTELRSCGRRMVVSSSSTAVSSHPICQLATSPSPRQRVGPARCSRPTARGGVQRLVDVYASLRESIPVVGPSDQTLTASFDPSVDRFPLWRVRSAHSTPFPRNQTKIEAGTSRLKLVSGIPRLRDSNYCGRCLRR